VDIHSKEYRRKLRDSLLQEWPYAAHWVDSAIKTALLHTQVLAQKLPEGRQEEEEARRPQTLRQSQTNTH